MKGIFTSCLLSVVFAMSVSTLAHAETQSTKVLAFPGAEGAGRYTTGGRGGVVYHVTTLEDDASNKGSLRYAINQKGARTIVFDVSGVIELKSGLSIKNGNLTIAGQTAPGDGIVLKNYGLKISASNVIIRYIRCRLGDAMSDQEDDAVSACSAGNGLSNIIVDHVSASWSVDECFSSYGVNGLTVQWSIISESLYHSIHGKGSHGYGGIWGGCPATFHHNLIAHHSSRTPRLCGSRYNNSPATEMVDIRNNVFYNWGPTNGGYAGEGGSYNFINNYYKPGPMTATKTSLCGRIFQANADNGSNNQPAGVWGIFHMSGNYFDATSPYMTSAGIAEAELTNTSNWNGLDLNGTPSGGKISIQSQNPFACASVTTHTAQVAMEKVLQYAGCSKSRDVIDARLVSEVESGTYTYEGSKGGTKGLIDTPSDVEGYGIYKSTSSPVLDENNNGIPDSREELYFGDFVDGNGHDKDPNYTNLEWYLNRLVQTTTEAQLADGVLSPDNEPGLSEEEANTNPFMASRTDEGYDYYWFNSEHADQVNEWLSDGTITLTEGSLNASFTNANSAKIGALSLKKEVGEVVFKCPGVAAFMVYMFRTGSFAGSVSVSTDGVNFTEVQTYSGSKYLLELDLSSVVASDEEVYVKITNAATGSLQIQGVKILSPKETTAIDGIEQNRAVRFSRHAVEAADALNITAFTMDGKCAAFEYGSHLSLENLSSGVYVVRVILKNGQIIVRKVVR